MNINALLMGDKDNVVTCITEINPGDTVTFRRGKEFLKLTAGEAIPFCHKIALENIPTDGEVIKYNECIGRTSEAISRGRLVAHHNLFSVQRNYDAEMVSL